MLLLLSFALVLVATVLLVLGLLSDYGPHADLPLDREQRRSVRRAGGRPAAQQVLAPSSAAPPAEPLPASEPEPAAVTAAPAATAGDDQGEEWLATDQGWTSEDDWDGEEVEFPIADYDDLTVGQILPLLPAALRRRDRRRGGARAAHQGPRRRSSRSSLRFASPLLRRGRPRPGAAGAGDALASYTEPAGADAAAASWDEDDDWFPIEDYESLSAAQIRPLLVELDVEELLLVRDKEIVPGPAPQPARRDRPPAAAPAAAPATVAASEPAVRRATGRKAPATKRPAAKKAATAKKGSRQEGGDPQEGTREEGCDSEEGRGVRQGAGQEGGARQEGGTGEAGRRPPRRPRRARPPPPRRHRRRRRPPSAPGAEPRRGSAPRDRELARRARRSR